MARFRKKPAEFTAEQLVPGEPLPPGVGVGHDEHGRPFFYVVTAQNRQVTVDYGEWIVPEPDGSGYYPIKAELMPTIADRIGG